MLKWSKRGDKGEQKERKMGTIEAKSQEEVF